MKPQSDSLGSVDKGLIEFLFAHSTMGNYYVGERVIVFILVFMDRLNIGAIIMGANDLGDMRKITYDVKRLLSKYSSIFIYPIDDGEFI